MTQTIQHLAEQFEQAFFSKSRQDGSHYFALRDDAPEMLWSLVSEAHGTMPPDDHRYRFIVEALAILADHDHPEMAYADLECDLTTYDLTQWLNSRTSRVFYLAEAQRSHGPLKEGFQLLALAQKMEKTEVFYSVLNSLYAILRSQKAE